MAYNTYATSPMRGYLNNVGGTVFSQLCTNEDMMKHITKTVNRTWCKDTSTTVDANQCTHTADTFWLLGNGNVNFNPSYLKDYAYDTAVFLGIFSESTQTSTKRIKYSKNSDGSTGSSAYYWWLRSAGTDDGEFVGLVIDSGYIGNGCAGSAYGVSPVCLIG